MDPSHVKMRTEFSADEAEEEATHTVDPSGGGSRKEGAKEQYPYDDGDKAESCTRLHRA
jgi:hypothetical protein